MGEMIYENNSIVGTTGMLIPLILLLTTKKGVSINLKDDNDLDNKIEMLEKISPYFSERDQIILYKVQDILDVFNKVNRVRQANYVLNAKEEYTNLSTIEKKEMILKEFSNHISGEKKEMIDKLLDTKSKIEKTRSNVLNYKSNITVSNEKNLDTMLNLIRCFEPILEDDSLGKVKKLEKIIDILKKPDEQL